MQQSRVMSPLLLFSLLALSTVPGGDSANLSLQRSPLDVTQLSRPQIRTKRSLVASNVIDEHGNPVFLHSNGASGKRTIVNPFVTSHKLVTSRRKVASRDRPTRSQSFRTQTQKLRRRHLSGVQSPRQTLHGSRGFATVRGNRYDIRPDQGVVPHNRWQVRANHHHRYNAATNQRRRYSAPANQRGRYSAPTNHVNRQTTQSQQPWRIVTNQGTSGSQGHHGSGGVGGASHSSGGAAHSSGGAAHSSGGTGSTVAFVTNAPTTEAPIPDEHRSEYEHGLEPHMPLNAGKMATFLIKKSTQKRPYLDRTKGLGTLHTSRRGQCPVVDQSRCPPLPSGPLPPSCSNDYQCREPTTKCCYDPCLTVSKCVRPVGR
ncbi:hypothetical protein FJT64_002168 [Amphibalanus amphitrite]|uniref:WAP domain-containing protein n=1 Tax=Amphibalanus amphitrite TaxID=1232801 RepID=A0A6A4X1V6_AMPAM|nr:hypothetical protein FJT64_002168 [Amphibalanus amphitrite]